MVSQSQSTKVVTCQPFENDTSDFYGKHTDSHNTHIHAAGEGYQTPHPSIQEGFRDPPIVVSPLSRGLTPFLQTIKDIVTQKRRSTSWKLRLMQTEQLNSDVDQ